VAVLLALGVAALAARTAFTPHKPDQAVLRTEIMPPEGVRFTGGLTPMALSPDGTKLVFVGANKEGKRMVWVRQMDTADTRAIPGTEGAEVPFWSPDSGWVGFAARSKLQKIDVIGGGQPQIICDITGRTGGLLGERRHHSLRSGQEAVTKSFRLRKYARPGAPVGSFYRGNQPRRSFLPSGWTARFVLRRREWTARQNSLAGRQVESHAQAY
jgi:hypothetical protein